MPQLTWLVTGCTSGIGEIFVRHILARGDKVIASTRGDVSRLSRLAEAGARTVSLDVTSPASEIKAIVDKLLEDGPIDVLVNNAGYVEAGMAEETSYEHYLAQFETNFFGVIKTTQAVLPHFRERRSGTVVFTGSVGGVRADAGASAVRDTQDPVKGRKLTTRQYCSTKFALEAWCQSLRLETAHLNIKCIMFELGFFRTNVMHADHMKSRSASSIADYDEVRKSFSQFVDVMNDHQPGDPEKAVRVMLDVVRAEGVARGDEVPQRIPLGSDTLEALQARLEADQAICRKYGDLSRSTDYD